jgi:CheY-like chemotaxis protein
MIWLIDDNSDDLYLICKAIRRQSPLMHVVCFEDPNQALAAFLELDSKHSSGPSLVVSDLNFPGESGIIFLTKLEDYCRTHSLALPSSILVSTILPEDLSAQTAHLRSLKMVLQKSDYPEEFCRVLLGYLP